MQTLLDTKQCKRFAGNINHVINERAKLPARKVGTADNVYTPALTSINLETGCIERTAKYELAFAGEVLEIKTQFAGRSLYKAATARRARGRVSQFSEKSRRRLAKVCAGISWGAMPFLFVTLTYPGELAREVYVDGVGPVVVESYGKDGRRCSADLRAFRERWEDRFGPPVAVWKREYQERGAVHFHLAILRPEGVSLVEMQRWVKEAWFQIVGSGQDDHRRRGTGVEVMRKPPVAYFACHGQHGRDKKGYQNEVPVDCANPGRFWGLWNLAPEWDRVDLSPNEFVELRRIMRAWAKSRRLKVRPIGGRVQGMWLRSRYGAAYPLAFDFLRAVRLSVT